MIHRSSQLVAAFTLLTAVSLSAAEYYDVQIERGVAVKMRDGVTLRADIYRPKADGRFPVLLQRTPYNKAVCDFCLRAAARGVVAIVQDVRGRYTSEGDWYPFKNESNDGYDTVEWAAALPYSDGKVGMWGGSYVGATQMLTAIASPPHLAGIFPFVTASNYHDGWTYQGGAFEQWFNESWTSGLAEDTLDRRVARGTNAMDWAETLPLSDYPLLRLGGHMRLGELAPYFLDWLAHPAYDDYWKRWSIEEHFSSIRVPVYSVGAWYDIFLGGTLRNYLGVKARGGSEAARTGGRLLVMIGGHAGGGRKIGEVDFGPAAELDLEGLTLDWYDHLLKGQSNAVASQKPVKIFVLGENVWREEDAWPPARAVSTRYYVHSDGGANSLAGSGTLDTTAPADEKPDRFIYDPADPVPTVGGPLCCDSAHLAPGPRDQRPVEAREDVLVYATPPFEKDFEVTGPVSLELFASSSAVDTDFTGKLVDVWPDGFAQNLTEGIQRARYRNSQEKAEFLNPAQIYELTLDLWATSNVFRAGHRLRLEISSSNFPRFDRNLNSGEEPESRQHFVKATNTIYHDREHPTALVLSVIPR
jgi:uncharacterized protein